VEAQIEGQKCYKKKKGVKKLQRKTRLGRKEGDQQLVKEGTKINGLILRERYKTLQWKKKRELDE